MDRPSRDAVPPAPAAPPGVVPSRREFLRYAALAAGAATGASLVGDLRADPPRPAGPLHVVVLGAGLAGLVAAYELEKLGHSVTLLEADKRHVGGRARTLRFEGGLYHEAGAMRVPKKHPVTRQYLAELNVPLRPFVHSNREAYYYCRGHRERIKDAKNLNRLYRLRDDEKELSPEDLWAKAVTAYVKDLTEAQKADFSADVPATDVVRKLDAMSVQDLAEKAGLSAEAMELFAVTNAQEAELFTGASETLREEIKDFWLPEFDEIVGGTDLFPAAFLARLRAKPMMNCEVIGLAQDAGRRKAAAIYLDPDEKEQRAEGDFVLCTLPLPVVQRLRADPAFSPAKQRAIRQVYYDSSTKVLLVAQKRFWEAEEGIFGGGTYTDLPTAITYYPSDNATARDPKVSAGPGVMLASYTWGMPARRMAALPPARRAEVVRRHLSLVHPRLGDEKVIRQWASWSWDNHPWSAGAFAWYLPGQFTALHRDVIRPEGRVYFAGEHASLAHTWMQGALESGVRAVKEMLAAAAKGE